MVTRTSPGLSAKVCRLLGNIASSWEHLTYADEI